MRRLLGVGLAALVVAGCSTSGARHEGGRATSTTRAIRGPVVLAGEQALPQLYEQGLARVPGGWIFSGNDGLWRTDEKLREVVVMTPAIPAAWVARGFNHIGDIDVVGRYVYAPFEQPDYAKGQQATASYDRDTLRFVDAVVLAQHENSFVTIDPRTMTAYTMDHFDGNALLRYDVKRGWKPLAPLRMSMELRRTQGADVGHGAVWISTTDDHNGLYRVDLATGRVEEVGTLGHPTGEGEGIDVTDLPSGFAHTLCIDVRRNPVWFGHFRAARPAP